MEDISELEILMVSAITRLNDYGVLIGREESRGKNRRISFLWLRGEVFDPFRKETSWSAD